MDSEIAIVAQRSLLIFHGSITVNFQDAKIISMEATEKSRFVNGRTEFFAPNAAVEEVSALAKKLAVLFRGMTYGKIILFIKNGKLVQYSRQEQYRLSDAGEGL